MPHCHEMKVGQVYACGECGIELQVVKECTECGTSEDECCHETCEFVCCDKPLVLKG
ncbi:MAG: hypothetical protein JSV33_09685 [bacterium]|nr:MAG: hypothetical protein JSV33_09685 [bacterium]